MNILGNINLKNNKDNLNIYNYIPFYNYNDI